MPQKLAGSLILPPVSDPRASAASQDATDAAEPPEEPPGTLFKFQGLWTFLKAEFSLEEPIANSSRLALPTIGIKLFNNFWVAVALYGDTKFSNILLDAVVFEPIRFMLSLRARGTPARSGKSSPLAIFSSTFFAVSSAISSVKELKAPSFSSIALIRSKEALVSSTAEISLFFSAFDCSIALFFNSSSITSPFIPLKCYLFTLL